MVATYLNSGGGDILAAEKNCGAGSSCLANKSLLFCKPDPGSVFINIKQDPVSVFINLKQDPVSVFINIKQDSVSVFRNI